MNLSPSFDPGLVVGVSMQTIPADYFFCPYSVLQALCLGFGLAGMAIGYLIRSRQWWFDSLIEKYWAR